jgi:hypothetical protein
MMGAISLTNYSEFLLTWLQNLLMYSYILMYYMIGYEGIYFPRRHIQWGIYSN